MWLESKKFKTKINKVTGRSHPHPEVIFCSLVKCLKPSSLLIFGYPVGDNHIRIGNRTRFTPFLYSTVRRFLLSAPLFLGLTISRYF